MVPVVALERQERVKTTSELAAVPRPQTMPHLCGLVYFTALLCLQVGGKCNIIVKVYNYHCECQLWNIPVHLCYKHRFHSNMNYFWSGRI